MMPTFKTKRTGFFESAEAEAIRTTLQDMITSGLYNTASSYAADSAHYPDHLISFTEKHMNYLNTHPKLDADMYLANLQLMTRTRH